MITALNLLEKFEDDVSESMHEFCIDAGSIENIVWFINHSCELSSFVQCVLSSQHDLNHDL